MELGWRGFGDFLDLLDGRLAAFRFPVSEIEARYGERYRHDCLFILGQLARVARAQGETIAGVLAAYGGYLSSLVDYRARYRSGQVPYGGTEAEVERLMEHPEFRRLYSYALTASLVLDRSRYELYRLYRSSIATWLRPGSALLEIGAGNCLDAAFASAHGRVTAYEKNEISRLWWRLLELEGRVDLRIETFAFDGGPRFDFVTMVELLEHVTDPLGYLEGMHRVLRAGGRGFVTFAVRMPQVDHLYRFLSVAECRDMLGKADLRIVTESSLVNTYRPYDEHDHAALVDDPDHAVTYCALVEKTGRGDPLPDRPLMNTFNDPLE